MARSAQIFSGIILILLVPIAIMLPGVPGDVMLIAGLALISPKLASKFKDFYNKHPKLCKLYAIVSTIAVLSFFLIKVINEISK